MLRIRILASALALTGCALAQAVPLSIGALSSNDDGSTAVIVDVLNKREWLRLDLSKTLTVAELVAATDVGGTFEGFSFGGVGDAHKFLDAYLWGGPTGNLCSSTAVSSTTEFCGATGVDLGADVLLGISFLAGNPWAWFVSDNGGGEDVGFLYSTDFPTSFGATGKTNDFISFADTDFFSGGSANDVGWLLYRDLPEPGSLTLAGLALVGLTGLRRWR